MTNQTRTEILYDGDCPICQQAVCLLDKNTQPFVTINARDQSPLRDAATAAGLDLDQGFVVNHDGKLYAGAAAAHLLADLLPQNGWRHQITRLLFGTEQRTRFFYPLCRSARRALLALRGKTLIRNLSDLIDRA
jgi:predicted DCC family thiol-disulfide oxidoreductase YuxK